MEKKLDSVFQKCPNCGASMIFSPNDQMLLCEHCQSKKDFDKTKEFLKHGITEKPTELKEFEDWKNQNKIIHCKTCGADIILNELEYSGKCPYCSSSYVSETKNLPSFVPDAIIPFAFDETEAAKVFKIKLRKKFFVPRACKKNASADNIVGIYVPSFSFDSSTTSKYVGVVQYRHTGPKNETYYTTQTISGVKKLVHNDVIVESSSKITQQELKNILPYDFSASYKFSEPFILGYVVEHFNGTFEDCYKKAKDSMQARIKSEILSSYGADSVLSFSMNTEFANERYAYRLVPLYQLSYSYKQKRYTTQMNGQTGKIGGKMPVSAFRVCLVVAFVVLVVVGLILLSTLQ